MKRRLGRSRPQGEARRCSSARAALGEKGRLDRDSFGLQPSLNSAQRGFAAWRQLANRRQDAGERLPLGQRRDLHGNDLLGIARLPSPQCSYKVRFMRFGPPIICGDTRFRSRTLGGGDALRRVRQGARRGASRLAAHQNVIASPGDKSQVGVPPRHLKTATGAIGPRSIRRRFSGRSAGAFTERTLSYFLSETVNVAITYLRQNVLARAAAALASPPRRFGAAEAMGSSTGRGRPRRACGRCEHPSIATPASRRGAYPRAGADRSGSARRSGVYRGFRGYTPRASTAI